MAAAWQCLLGRVSGNKYQVDTARDGAGRPVEHANKQCAVATVVLGQQLLGQVFVICTLAINNESSHVRSATDSNNFLSSEQEEEFTTRTMI